MKRTIKLLIIIFAIMAINLIAGADMKGIGKTTQIAAACFHKGVYRADSPDKKNHYKNYFYVFYDETSGHTEDFKMGIGLPFSCVQKDGYVKFKFGGISEPEETFKIKAIEDNVITGSFESGSLLIFTPVSDANPDNFDAVEYTKKENNFIKNFIRKFF